MALTRESISEILKQHGYRAVFEESGTSGVRSASRYSEARSPRIEVLQRQYGAEPDRVERNIFESHEPRYTGTGAIVTVEPLNGRGHRKAVVLSDEGELLGEQG